MVTSTEPEQIPVPLDITQVPGELIKEFTIYWKALGKIDPIIYPSSMSMESWLFAITAYGIGTGKIKVPQCVLDKVQACVH
jgi:hypothetical protein